MTSAAGSWRAQLEAWAIPDELLEAVPESPYGWPAELWKRRRAWDAQATGDTLTLRLLRQLLPEGGSLLDVGAGTGRVTLPLAQEGYRVTGVERNPGMADGFRQEAEELRVDATLVEASWPEAAEEVDVHDVVLSAHVVYDVQDIAPFLAALHDRARQAVVIELTPTHPWSSLAPYYRALHDLDRPDGPTAELLAEVVEQELGFSPKLERWRRRGGLWFLDLDELVRFYRKRLVLPEDRTDELRELLAPDVQAVEGRLFLIGAGRELVTLWWEKTG